MMIFTKNDDELRGVIEVARSISQEGLISSEEGMKILKF